MVQPKLPMRDNEERKGKKVFSALQSLSCESCGWFYCFCFWYWCVFNAPLTFVNECVCVCVCVCARRQVHACICTRVSVCVCANAHTSDCLWVIVCASVCALGFFFYLYILSGSNEFLLVFFFFSVCFVFLLCTTCLFGPPWSFLWYFVHVCMVLMGVNDSISKLSKLVRQNSAG